MIQPLFQFQQNLQIATPSIFTPRGVYLRSREQFLHQNEEALGNHLQDEFYREFESSYSSDVIKKYLMDYFKTRPSIKASDILRADMSDEAVLRLLYILIYAGDELDYSIIPLKTEIEHQKFRLADFEIIRGYEL
jgi:hypothetical protein